MAGMRVQQIQINASQTVFKEFPVRFSNAHYIDIGKVRVPIKQYQGQTIEVLSDDESNSFRLVGSFNGWSRSWFKMSYLLYLRMQSSKDCRIGLTNVPENSVLLTDRIGDVVHVLMVLKLRETVEIVRYFSAGSEQCEILENSRDRIALRKYPADRKVTGDNSVRRSSAVLTGGARALPAGDGESQKRTNVEERLARKSVVDSFLEIEHSVQLLHVFTEEARNRVFESLQKAEESCVDTEWPEIPAAKLQVVRLELTRLYDAVDKANRHNLDASELSVEIASDLEAVYQPIRDALSSVDFNVLFG